VDKQAEFEAMIQRHLTRAHKLRAIQQMIAEDPGIVPDLLEILTSAAGTPVTPAPEARRRIDAKTQAEKVVAFFRSRGNTMATVRQIAEGTGLSRGVINALLYNSSQKGLFKKLTVGGKKRKFWRLKEDEQDTDGEVSAEDLAEMGIDESDLDGGSEDADELED
jgi:ribonuclease D